MKKICLPNEQTRVASEYSREEEKGVVNKRKDINRSV